MPIYEYQCSKCGEIFEAFQKISDDPLSQCKFCRGKVEKLISHSSFQLKGSGWYLTDYGNRTGSDSGSSSKSTPAKSEEKAGSTTSATETTGSSKTTSTKES